ncbi:MAG: phage integrase N-terminal SAM-like domain-containing protein [Sulfurihydrogenibium sp.]|jgi:integrase|nr:phage integrase N-terminal SAM-like domain-containing protein [Sulfurihydrogenibium sp.]
MIMEKKLDEFIERLKNRYYDAKTVSVYQNLLKHFLNFYENNIVVGDTIRERDVEKFIRYLKSRGLKSTTIKATLRISKRFIESVGGKWEGNIGEIYRERDIVESANPFSEIELRQIFDHLWENNKIYYYLSLTLYGFGLRISEALSLKPQDFIEIGGKVFVRVRPEISKFNKGRLSPLILKGEYREDLVNFIMSRNGKGLREHTMFTYYNDIQRRLW